MIRLDYADVKYPPSKGVVAGIRRSAGLVNLYPREGYGLPKEKIARYCGLRPENIVLTNGSDEAIEIITQRFGGKVLIPVPTFEEYRNAATRNRCTIEEVPCLCGEDYGLRFQSEQLSDANLVWIVNPNNPTGTIIPRERILDVVSKTKGYVAVDECYVEFSKESVVDRVEKCRNLIVIRSFSKGFALAGLRLGFIAANKGLIDELKKCRAIFPVNSLAAEAGALALCEVDYSRKLVRLITRDRNRLKRYLEAKSVFCFPSAANFLLARFKDRGEARRVCEELAEKDILVLPAWNKEFRGLDGPYVRIAVGTSKDMDGLIKALDGIL